MAANCEQLLQNGEEVDGKECVIKGTIPTWLQGQVIRNGPGEFDVGNDTFSHWFDGHGLLHKFCIVDGSVTYSSKFLQSEVFKTNRKHNRVLLGSFGEASYPDPCKNIFSRFFTKLTSLPPGDNCNVNVAVLENAHYAITDPGCAYKFDPDTLETESFLDMKEILNIPVTTAHPHYDKNGDYYNIGTSFGMSSFYNVVQVPAESMNKPDPLRDLKVHSKIKIEGNSMKPTYMHSFVLTENFVVLHDQSMRINVWRLSKTFFTWDAPITCLENDKTRDSYFHVIDKEKRSEVPVTYRAKARFCFHHINGYEVEENGARFLVIDMIAADQSPFGHNALDPNIIRTQRTELTPESTTRPYRFVLPLDVKDCPVGKNLITLEEYQASAKLQEDGSVFLEPELLVGIEDNPGIELPQINYDYNGRKYKYFYGCGQEYAFGTDWLVKVNVDKKEIKVWEEKMPDLEPMFGMFLRNITLRRKDCFPSEPIFVQRPGASDEDDGIILSTVISSAPDQPVFMLILDAQTFTEIARAEVDVVLPPPIHGQFKMAK